MPSITPSDQVKRASLTKILMSQYRAPEIKNILEQEYNITTTENTINRDIKDILDGKYNTFFDDLLDTHYPQIYSDVINIVKEDMDKLKQIADDTANEKVRTGAIVAHARLALDFIRVLHQAPVIREMKKLSVQAKRLAREVMSQGTMKRVTLLPVDPDTEMKVITLNENLEQISEEIILRINVESDANPKGPDEN